MASTRALGTPFAVDHSYILSQHQGQSATGWRPPRQPWRYGSLHDERKIGLMIKSDRLCFDGLSVNALRNQIAQSIIHKAMSLNV